MAKPLREEAFFFAYNEAKSKFALDSIQAIQQETRIIKNVVILLILVS
ncbi:hypothetical protein J2W91_001154 [Paenibacillus amylolyticus]|uniref:Uncharacterized protein n=1 Tax=Paenibacillus amylolyticus TaxID=1451 RepID=A0AAP5LL65_PAEAM|nr:hypothetical protein [Paenibacillus amylolyticus]